MLNLRRKASGRFSRPCFSALFLFPDQTEEVIGENIFQFRPGEMLGKDSAQVHAGAAYREIAAEKQLFRAAEVNCIPQHVPAEKPGSRNIEICVWIPADKLETFFCNL